MTDQQLTSDEIELQMIDGLSEELKNGDLTRVFLKFQRTLSMFVKERPGRGNNTVQYVEGWYIKQVLNLATKFKWSSFIDGQLQTNNEVIMWGRIVISVDGQEYTQSAFGQSEIHYYKCDKIRSVQQACVKDRSVCKNHTCEKPVCVGDDYKAALTDMIKKAASQWGIAGDVYSKRFLEQ